MERNNFPIEFAIALLLLLGILYIGRHLSEKTIPGSATRPAATAPR